MSFFLGTFLFCLLEAAFVGYVYTTTKTAPHQTRLFHLTLYSLAVFCCWMMWGLMYMAQMHPMINPILEG